MVQPSRSSRIPLSKSRIPLSKSRISLFILPLTLFLTLTACQPTTQKQTQIPPCPGKDPTFSLTTLRTTNQGQLDPSGANYVVIFDPRSPLLDFKVNLGLTHPLYQRNAKGEVDRHYSPKRFSALLQDNNSKLDGQSPIVAINADYIDLDHSPQGLNISRGIPYKGLFAESRSSFAISGGPPQTRKATIQVGQRSTPNDQFNAVGGNGRFYRDGIFKDICSDLGTYACRQSTPRSMATITDRGYVIFLVNNVPNDATVSNSQSALYPSQFDAVLKGISTTACIGQPQDAILFDGGLSPGLYSDNKIQVENPGPIGSIFLIYAQKNGTER